LLFKLGNYTGPIENFDKALAIDPHHIRALDNKGLALTYLGNHVGSIQCSIEYSDKALAIDPAGPLMV